MTFVKTRDFVQVSGTGDFTKINIAPGDVGGQFDSKTNTPDGATVKTNSQAASSWVVSGSATPDAELRLSSRQTLSASGLAQGTPNTVPVNMTKWGAGSSPAMQWAQKGLGKTANQIRAIRPE